MTDVARQAEEEIIRRRDALVRARTELLEQRATVMIKLRGVDRDLADCKAAARFFGLNVDFPPDEREEYDRIRAAQRDQEIAQRDFARRQLAQERAAQVAFRLEPQNATDVGADKISPAVLSQGEFRQIASVSSVISAAPAGAATKRPPVRQIALAQLREAGSAGLKASAIREYMDKEYALTVHDKTVGMTLYRMSQEGLVHRDGHTWFFGPPTAETKNPGVDAPGSDSSFE